DCAPHCDSVCIGEADLLWPTIIDDARKKKLQAVYRNLKFPEPHEIASAKKSVFDVQEKYDWHASLISITRGCPFGCDWCNVPLYQGDKIRLRPMENVVEEIRQLSGQEFYITDDMIMLNRPRIQKYMMELCEKIRDFKVHLFLSCSPAMNTDPAYLDAIAAAGAKSMYTVFASDPFSARFYARHKGIWQRTVDLVRQLEERGIRFFGSFGLGFDTCNADQFDLILEFCEEAGVKTAEFFIATPFPNTPFWHRIAQEGRLIISDWKKFNGANVVFRPKTTSVEALRDGFISLWKDFFSRNSIETAHNTFRQKLENILKSKEYSQQVKDAVSRGMAKQSAASLGTLTGKGADNG
ncbi:MAG: radical SAM protein, partial [Chitinispirillaceae bacterium]|nr:radical SAM protein [Chitinispirillaceae bacterium]